MEIELIGAIDYNKVNEILKSSIDDLEKQQMVLQSLKDIEIGRHSEIVSAAARLSRFPGDVLESLDVSSFKTLQQNSKFINRVISMGHKSILDHDYLVFSLKNVSAIVEQMIISERYSSFTIKSRREVDFSKAGYYIPDFYDSNNKLLNNNLYLKERYTKHMDSLFNQYKSYIDNGVSVEDARYILPYSYHSNIIMGLDAHTLLDMIIKYTKTKYAKVSELNDFGEKLYKIAKVYTPYLIPYIDSFETNYVDDVDSYLNTKIEKEEYKILDKVHLLNSSDNVDDQILISSIMRRYQYDYLKAKDVYEKLCISDSNFKANLMRKIIFDSDRLELTQVNFDFQIPTSYAMLTHITRHRTNKLVIPDFYPNVDVRKYKTPPVMRKDKLDVYNQVFENNYQIFNEFRNNGVRDEDLIYFTLSGNMTNILVNMDGWTVRHILELRECNKAQWETRRIFNQVHEEIRSLEHAELFSKNLGPTCETLGICNEKKESCGKIKVLKKFD